MAAIPSINPNSYWRSLGRCFTPVKGKDAFLPDWTNRPMTYDEARDYPGSTGVGVIHKYANTCCLDIDDYAKAIPFFESEGIDLSSYVGSHYRIESPNPNSDKFLFRTEADLSFAQGRGVIEFRVGPLMDVLDGSQYLDPNQFYNHSGPTEPQPIPQDLLIVWKKKSEELREARKKYNANGFHNPFIKDGRHSVIYWFNKTYSIRGVLEANGCPLYRHNRYTWAQGSSKGGIVLYEASQEGREGQELAFIHHASMGSLTKRLVDAFELQAWFDNSDKENYQQIAIAKYSQQIRVVNDEGVDMGTVHELNTAVTISDIDERELEAATIKVDVIPDHCLAPDDLFGELVVAIDESRWRPNLMTAHVATQGIVTHLAGGSFAGMHLADRLRTFSLVVGPPSCGKGTVIDGPQEVITQIPELYVFGSQSVYQSFGSREGFEDALVRNPDLLFCWDEFGHGLKEASLNKDSHRSKLVTYLIEIWPMAHKIRQQRAKANEAGEPIYAPHPVVIGTSTEDVLANGLSKEFVHDGLISRFLFFPAAAYKKELRRNPRDMNFSDELKKNILNLFKVSPDPIVNRLEGRLTRPRRVTWDNKVADYFYEISKEVDGHPPHSLQSVISGRKIVNVKAWAMGRAVINNPEKPIVTLDIAEWANYIVDRSIWYQYRLLKDKVCESPNDAAVQACINRLKEAKGKPVKAKTLLDLNPMRKLTSIARQNVFKEISEWRDDVEYKENANVRGKKSRVFKYTGKE